MVEQQVTCGSAADSPRDIYNANCCCCWSTLLTFKRLVWYGMVWYTSRSLVSRIVYNFIGTQWSSSEQCTTQWRCGVWNINPACIVKLSFTWRSTTSSLSLV